MGVVDAMFPAQVALGHSATAGHLVAAQILHEHDPTSGILSAIFQSKMRAEMKEAHLGHFRMTASFSLASL